ncbi:hypothetical protein STENM327S_04626 [Streptomyces tendae]
MDIGAEVAVIDAPSAAAPVVPPAPEVPPAAVAAPEPAPPSASAPAPVATPVPTPAPPAPAPSPPAPVAPSVPAPVPAPAAVPAAVPASVPAPTPAPTPVAGSDATDLRGQTVAMSRIRRIIGENLQKALREQAQLTSVVEVDVTALLRLRLRERAGADVLAREGVKLSPMPFFVKAAAQALKAHPAVNARINEGEGTITYFDRENVGIAVDTEKGLMTPVIKGAGDLSIAGIARATAELAGRARSGRLTPDDVSGATFTISNTGSRGALFDTVVVPPGQAAILGTGAVVKRPSVVTTEDGGQGLGIRDMAYLSLSYDHPMVDGADTARYLTAVKAILEAAALEGDLG